jgi:hypothetical protein
MAQVRRHKAAGTNREIADGKYVEPAKTTLATFLGRWLEHIRTQVSPKTFERYSEICQHNISPLLGSILLTKVRPEQNFRRLRKGPHLRPT